MFNSPFNSFHDTVAEAKEERERLDRLLTISTPRERTLVASILVLLSIFTGWLFFGNVARTLVLEGVLLDPGEHLLANQPSVQAVVWLDGQAASDISAGMPAVVELSIADGDSPDVTILRGQIATISPVSLSEIPTSPEMEMPTFLYRVGVALDDRVYPSSIRAGVCRVVVELGKQSPITIFRMRPAYDADERP